MEENKKPQVVWKGWGGCRVCCYQCVIVKITVEPRFNIIFSQYGNIFPK